MAAKGLFGRLLKKTATKATKKVVKKTPKVKPTVGAKRKAVRTKAKTAAKTKVNTNPKVGTKAVLKGKDVYWAGKNYGWQSKASYNKVVKPTAGQKITSSVASKTKPKTTGTTSKPKYASAPPKKGDAPKGTRVSANGSKTITAKGRSTQKLRERAAAKRTGKPKTNTRVRTEIDTGSKVATAPGVKRPPGSPKRGTNRPTKLTARERQRALLTKNRDIGAKAAAAKTPKSTTRTVKEAGAPKPSQRGYSAGSEPRNTRSAARKAQTEAQKKAALTQRPPSKQVGGARTTAEAAQGAAKAGFKRKSETVVQRRLKALDNDKSLSGVERQRAKKKLLAEQNKASTRVGRAAREKSLEDSRRSQLNRSPSSSKQDPKDLKQSNTARKSSRDLMREAGKLTQDMTTRKAAGKLGPTRSMGAKGGKTASNSEGLKIGSSTKSLTSKQKATIIKPTEVDVVGTRTKGGKQTPIKRSSSAAEKAKVRSSSPATQKAAAERKASRGIDKALGKQPASTKAPTRSAARTKTLREKSRQMTAEMREFKSLPKSEQDRLMRSSGAAQSGSAKSGEVRLQGGTSGSKYSYGTGSDRGGKFNNAGTHDGTKSRSVKNKGSKKDSRSTQQQQAAKEALEASRERRAAKAIERETQAAFKRGAGGAGSAGW